MRGLALSQCRAAAGSVTAPPLNFSTQADHRVGDVVDTTHHAIESFNLSHSLRCIPAFALRHSRHLHVGEIIHVSDLLLEGDAPDGKFLVRRRPGFPNDYVLGVVYKGKPTHHLVTYGDNNLYSVNKKQFGECGTVAEVSCLKFSSKRHNEAILYPRLWSCSLVRLPGGPWC